MHSETFTEGAFTNCFPLRHQDPEAWVKELFAHFNRRVEGPQLRVIDEITIIELSEESSALINLQHNWEKTNIMTQMDSRGQYDSYKCAECGVTSKRRTLDAIFERDPLYKGETFKFCNKAKAYIEKRRAAGDFRR